MPETLVAEPDTHAHGGQLCTDPIGHGVIDDQLSRRERGPIERAVTDLALVALAGGALGVLTAYAQGWLGGPWNPLANSAGPWCLAAFGLAALTRGGPRLTSAAGTITLAMLELGYVLGAHLESHPSAPSTIAFWVAAALVAGPLIGLGAHWVRTSRGARAALGTGLIAGILLGEGAHEITQAGFPAFGAAETVCAAVVLGITQGRRDWKLLLIAGPITTLVAAVLFAVYASA